MTPQIFNPASAPLHVKVSYFAPAQGRMIVEEFPTWGAADERAFQLILSGITVTVTAIYKGRK